jgi:hypothetical protein
VLALDPAFTLDDAQELIALALTTQKLSHFFLGQRIDISIFERNWNGAARYDEKRLERSFNASVVCTRRLCKTHPLNGT